MSCGCNDDIEIYEFGSPGHYESTLRSIEHNIENGFLTIILENQFEIVFQCNDCKQF